MKWVLFTGTWRLTNTDVEADVRAAVREVISRGDGVLTGGATGVDFFAMDEAFILDSTASKLLVIIPTNLDLYIEDVRDNWCHAPITEKEVNSLADLLRKIKKANETSIIEMPFVDISQHEYDLRNIEEVKRADEVYAFHVNESSGTQHTIDQAVIMGVPVVLHKKYSINNE